MQVKYGQSLINKGLKPLAYTSYDRFVDKLKTNPVKPEIQDELSANFS